VDTVRPDPLRRYGNRRITLILLGTNDWHRLQEPAPSHASSPSSRCESIAQEVKAWQSLPVLGTLRPWNPGSRRRPPRLERHHEHADQGHGPAGGCPRRPTSNDGVHGRRQLPSLFDDDRPPNDAGYQVLPGLDEGGHRGAQRLPEPSPLRLLRWGAEEPRIRAWLRPRQSLRSLLGGRADTLVLVRQAERESRPSLGGPQAKPERTGGRRRGSRGRGLRSARRSAARRSPRRSATRPRAMIARRRRWPFSGRDRGRQARHRVFGRGPRCRGRARLPAIVGVAGPL